MGNKEEGVIYLSVSRDSAAQLSKDDDHIRNGHITIVDCYPDRTESEKIY